MEKSDCEYNCGGFALKTFDWVDFDFFDDERDIDTLIKKCMAKIKKRIKGFKVIQSYKDIPESIPVIGFRIAICDSFPRDFHFVIREDGFWKHKMGGRKPELVYFNIDELWPGGWDWNYNSEIVWFIKEEKVL